MKRQKSKRIHLTVLRMRECRPKLFHLLLCYFSTLITKKCGMECVCVRWRVWQSQTWACKLANSFSVSLFVAHIELQKQTVLLRCFHTEFAVNVNLNVVIESHTAIWINSFLMNGFDYTRDLRCMCCLLLIEIAYLIWNQICRGSA